MFRNNDVLGGAMLAVGGAVVSLYAATSLNMGTLREVGAGMFPLIIGLLMAVLGVAIVLTSLQLNTPPLTFDWRTFAIVSASIAVFALTITRFGMIPSIVLTTLAATFASDRITWAERLGVAAVLSALIYVIFILLLDLQIPIFAWSL